MARIKLFKKSHWDEKYHKAFHSDTVYLTPKRSFFENIAEMSEMIKKNVVSRKNNLTKLVRNAGQIAFHPLNVPNVIFHIIIVTLLSNIYLINRQSAKFFCLRKLFHYTTNSFCVFNLLTQQIKFTFSFILVFVYICQL